MTDLFLERMFKPSINPDTVYSMALEAMDCFGTHRVEWQRSCLSNRGHKMVCWFRAPDMESARIAMRQSDIDQRVLWRGSVHDKPGLGGRGTRRRQCPGRTALRQPVALQEIQAIEDAGMWCLETRNVSFRPNFLFRRS